MSHSPASKTNEPLEEYQAGWQATMRLLREGRSWSGNERNTAFLNCGLPRFANVATASGLNFADDGRGMAVVDWDHDGDLDLWLRNRTGPRLRLMLNQNRTGDGAADFVQLGLRGTTGNRDGIGARVVVELADPAATRLIRTLHAGDGFLSQSSKWLHFGLGPNARVRQVTVRWPGGALERFTGVEPGRRYLLVQASGKAGEVALGPRKLALAPGAGEPAPPTGAARVVLSRRFPPLTLPATTFDDPSLRVAGPPGRPWLINLWASWCAPCVAELQELKRHEQELRASGLAVLALTVEGIDENDQTTPADARRVLGEVDFPFEGGVATTQLLDKLELLQSFVFDRVPPFAVPQSFLFDEEGRLAVIYRGPLEVPQLLDDLRLLRVSGEPLRDGSLPFPGRWYSPFHPAEDYARTLANRFQERYPEDVVGFLQAAIEKPPPTSGDLHPAQQERQAEQRADDEFRLAATLAGQGRLDEAIGHFRRSLEIKPGHTGALNGLGMALSAQGQLGPAIEQFRRALAVAPDDADAHNNLALSLQLTGRVEEAIGHYRKALEGKPDSDQVRYNLGMALLMSGRPEDALDELRAALRLNPGSVGALTDLAWLLATLSEERLRQPEEALRLAGRAAEITRNQDPTVLDTLAAAFASAGRFDDAVRAAEAALGLATRMQDRELAQFIQARLELYKQGRPYRE